MLDEIFSMHEGSSSYEQILSILVNWLFWMAYKMCWGWYELWYGLKLHCPWCTVLDVERREGIYLHNHFKCPGIWQVVYSCLNWMLDLVSRCQVKVHISKEMVDQCFCPLPQAKTMPSMQQWSHPILFSLVCIEDFCLHVQFGHEEVS